MFWNGLYIKLYSLDIHHSNDSHHIERPETWNVTLDLEGVPLLDDPRWNDGQLEGVLGPAHTCKYIKGYCRWGNTTGSCKAWL